MFLGHEEILKRIERENLLENVDLDNVQGAGIDVRIDRLYSLASGAKILEKDVALPEIKEVEDFVLRPKSFYLLKTLEKVNMPSDLVAFMFPRSSLFRCGVSLRTAVIDPGYRGELTVGIYNENDYEVKIERHARFAQVVFAKVEGLTKLYKGRYQGGKVG
ncbi:MAG: dCTP deaminase [Candidatus Hydrothermarchaeales archaeon]